MINKNLERFQRDHFHGNSIVFSRLPSGKVNMIIPEECINRNQGKIDIEKFINYLMSHDDVFIEYETEQYVEHESLEEYWKKNNIMIFKDE